MQNKQYYCEYCSLALEATEVHKEMVTTKSLQKAFKVVASKQLLRAAQNEEIEVEVEIEPELITGQAAVPPCMPILLGSIPYSSIKNDPDANRSHFRSMVARTHREWPRCRRSGKELEIDLYTDPHESTRRSIHGKLMCHECE